LNFSSWCQASLIRSVTFYHIREEGGFDSQTLLTVSCIQASGTKLSLEKKKALINSQYLKNVHSLYLLNQDLDDNFIERMYRNTTLKRLINLDISRNQNITNRSLQEILNSDLGSIRDLPQISGRYGIPSSTMYVTACGTSIVSKDNQKHINLNRFGFTVEYKHPLTGKTTDTTAVNAVKFVECNF